MVKKKSIYNTVRAKKNFAYLKSLKKKIKVERTDSANKTYMNFLKRMGIIPPNATMSQFKKSGLYRKNALAERKKIKKMFSRNV